MSGGESMTVREVVDKQLALEAHLNKAIRRFEELTGVYIAEIDMIRDNDAAPGDVGVRAHLRFSP